MPACPDQELFALLECNVLPDSIKQQTLIPPLYYLAQQVQQKPSVAPQAQAPSNREEDARSKAEEQAKAEFRERAQRNAEDLAERRARAAQQQVDPVDPHPLPLRVACGMRLLICPPQPRKDGMSYCVTASMACATAFMCRFLRDRRQLHRRRHLA